MTDETHGQDPQEAQAEAGYEQETPAEAETWQSGEPPVDDFGDPAAEETATVSEETEAAAEVPAESIEPESESVESPKKRNMFLPVAAAIGGVLLLGAVAYWQFGGSSHNEPAPAPLNVAQFPKPKPAMLPTPPEPANIVPKTVAMAPVPFTPAQVEPVVPAPTVSAPAAATMSVVPAAPAVMPAATTAETKANEARLAALSLRVEDLQKSLDLTVQQLAQISSKLSAVQAAPAASAPNMAPIEDRLNRIEQQLTQNERSAPAQEASYSAKPSAPRTSHRTTHHATHHQAATVIESPPWVLRAATPDEAWVAKDADTTKLRAVHVGDELPGLGRVISIREEGGEWVVEGSHGNLRSGT